MVMRWIGCISALYGTIVRPCLSHFVWKFHPSFNNFAGSVGIETNHQLDEFQRLDWRVVSCSGIGIGRSTYAVALMPPPGCGEGDVNCKFNKLVIMVMLLLLL